MDTFMKSSIRVNLRLTEEDDCYISNTTYLILTYSVCITDFMRLMFKYITNIKLNQYYC